MTEALDNEDFEILVDPRLGKNYDRNEMFRMIEAAAACVRHSSVKRPRMSQVMLFSELEHAMQGSIYICCDFKDTYCACFASLPAPRW